MKRCEHRDSILPSNHSAYHVYPHDLQPLLQSLLTNLTDLDYEYEREREKLSRALKDTDVKFRVLEKLRDKHRDRRMPYLHQLAILQDRIHRQRN